MPASVAQDDYDSPWKDAVEHAFPEFIDFYFPDASRARVRFVICHPLGCHVRREFTGPFPRGQRVCWFFF